MVKPFLLYVRACALGGASPWSHSRCDAKETSTVLTLRAHSNAVQHSLADHKFGSINSMKVPPARMNDNQVRFCLYPEDLSRSSTASHNHRAFGNHFPFVSWCLVRL